MGNMMCLANVQTSWGRRENTIGKNIFLSLFVLITEAVLVSGVRVSASWAATQTHQGPDGKALYDQFCAKCHTGQVERAPSLKVMRKLPANFVLHSLQAGKMMLQGISRTTEERRAVAEWVTGKELPPASSKDETIAGLCADAPGEFRVEDGSPRWNGWGADDTNSRFQPAEQAGLSTDTVAKLKVKWVFGMPRDYQTSQPTVIGGRVFVGSMRGQVYSLDAKTGCLHWAFMAKAGVRSTPVVGQLPGIQPAQHVVYFGDAEANVYALDASTGKELWRTDIDEHQTARITGTLKLHENRLYIPITAAEDVAAADPEYECCTFRGAVAALNRINGRQIWKNHTILEPAAPIRKNGIGTQLWGPSGASVWSSPTLDLKHNRMYVTTGDNHSDPASLTSDAMIAYDLRSGEMLWSQQFTPNDAWNIACETNDRSNCPEAEGPDLDFASSSILRTLPNGKRILIAGQKSGVLHAVDPDQDGKIVWQQRVGKGGFAGGIQWGPAADSQRVYVALSDIGVTPQRDSDTGFSLSLDGSVGGGMFAYDIATGEQQWHVPPPGCGARPQCSPAQSAAVSVIPGVVFSGSVDAHLRAYSAQDGTVIWDYDANQEYETTNGVQTRGGSFDGAGPTIVDGMLYVNSGYGFTGGTGGNALVAFSVDGE